MKNYYYESEKGNGWGNYTLTTEMKEGRETIISCNDDTAGSGSSNIYSCNETFEGTSPAPRTDFKLISVEEI